MSGDMVVYKVTSNTKLSLPFFTAKVSAGFPSPADDFVEKSLDLNELLIKHPAATFFVRVQGDSMIGVGINNNDILVVDRSLNATNNKIIIAVVNGELTVKRLVIKERRTFLYAENVKYKPIEINEEASFEVWGVVTSVIHSLN